jgi:hypothetical protein
MNGTNGRMLIMKVKVGIMMGVVVVIGVVTLAGCGQKTEPQQPKQSGLLERTGQALDSAGKKTGQALENVGK